MQCKFLQVFSVTGYPLPFWQKNIQTGGLANHPYVYFMLDKAQDWCFCLSWTDWRHIVDYCRASYCPVTSAQYTYMLTSLNGLLAYLGHLGQSSGEVFGWH